MAVYSGDTNSTVWTDQGFLKATSDTPVTRDHKVTVENGVVTGAVPSPNPDQPKLPTDPDLTERRLQDDPAWRASIRRELAQRKAAGETALTAQDIINEYKAALP